MARRAGMLQFLLICQIDMTDAMASLERWKKSVRMCEATTGKELDDDLKIRIVTEAIPKDHPLHNEVEFCEICRLQRIARAMKSCWTRRHGHTRRNEETVDVSI